MTTAIIGMILVGAIVGWSWWKMITSVSYSRWLKVRRQYKHRQRLYRKKVLPAPDVRAQRQVYSEWRKA